MTTHFTNFADFCTIARSKLEAIHNIAGHCLTNDELRAAYDEGQMSASEVAEGFATYAHECGIENFAKAPQAAKPAKKSVHISRKQRDSIMADLGLVKVRGAVSGKIYYE